MIIIWGHITINFEKHSNFVGNIDHYWVYIYKILKYQTHIFVGNISQQNNHSLIKTPKFDKKEPPTQKSPNLGAKKNVWPDF